MKLLLVHSSAMAGTDDQAVQPMTASIGKQRLLGAVLEQVCTCMSTRTRAGTRTCDGRCTRRSERSTIVGVPKIDRANLATEFLVIASTHPYPALLRRQPTDECDQAKNRQKSELLRHDAPCTLVHLNGWCTAVTCDYRTSSRQ